MGWKIYFWILTLLIIAATGLSMAESLGIILLEEVDPAEREIWTWWDWIYYLPISGISLVGLFGYAYQKKIGENSFWKIFFVFLIIVDMIDTFHEYNIGTFDTEEMWRPEIVFPLLIAIFLPHYIALYLYSYKSKSLWNPQPTPSQ